MGVFGLGGKKPPPKPPTKPKNARPKSNKPLGQGR